jgi:hypothetical protein
MKDIPPRSTGERAFSEICSRPRAEIWMTEKREGELAVGCSGTLRVSGTVISFFKDPSDGSSYRSQCKPVIYETANCF